MAAAAAKPPASSSAPATLEGAPIPLTELRNQGKQKQDFIYCTCTCGRSSHTYHHGRRPQTPNEAGRAELLEILQAARGRKALVLDTALRGLLGHIVPEVIFFFAHMHVYTYLSRASGGMDRQIDRQIDAHAIN